VRATHKRARTGGAPWIGDMTAQACDPVVTGIAGAISRQSKRPQLAPHLLAALGDQRLLLSHGCRLCAHVHAGGAGAGAAGAGLHGVLLHQHAAVCLREDWGDPDMLAIRRVGLRRARLKGGAGPTNHPPARAVLRSRRAANGWPPRSAAGAARLRPKA
jgi:hypothetical protein